MEVTASNMLTVIVAALCLAGNARSGYIYPRPNLALQLPQTLAYYQEALKQKAIRNYDHKTYESVVSYSVPFEDLNYLHQYKAGQVHNANLAGSPKPTYAVNVPTVSLSTVNNLASRVPVVNIPAGNVRNINIPVAALPTAAPILNLPAPISSLHHNNIHEVNIPRPKISTLTKQESQLVVNEDLIIPNTNIKSVNIPALLTQQSNFAVNTIPQISIPAANVPPVNLQTPIKQGNLDLNTIQHTDAPVLNVPSVDLSASISPASYQQSHLEFNTEHHVINQDVNSELNGEIRVQNPVPARITKDIYFHVPPPEVEEPVVQTSVTPKKKIYKIIFIKVPSQATKNTAQVLAQNIAPIEEKTIIYVLSKKPEPQQVFLPKPKPSEHEVLFVKYSGNPELAAEQVIDTIEEPQSQLLSTTSLHPGLLNGAS